METKPFVLRNQINWKCTNWSIDEWKKVLGKTELEFQFGKSFSKEDIFMSESEWEKGRFRKMMTFENFCEEAHTLNQDSWCYSPYNYSFESIPSDNALSKDINWEECGSESNDFTLWIGSTNSYTPGHYDTYGHNLVVQLYGRKRWILFPPGQTSKLFPTRIPYEESSVFSQLYLFSYHQANENIKAQLTKTLAQTTPYMIVLEPGDLLFVPPHWWHFVQNLETSISVNQWFDQENSFDNQIKEGVVQLVMRSLIPKASDYRHLLFNTEKGLQGSTEDLINIIASLINQKQHNKESSFVTSNKYASNELKKELSASPIQDVIEALTGKSYTSPLVVDPNPCLPIHCALYKSLLNVICQDDVVERIVDDMNSVLNKS